MEASAPVSCGRETPPAWAGEETEGALCSIITFKQNNDISSRVAIDSDMATDLKQGEIYCSSSQELVKLNVPIIEFEEIKKYIPSLIVAGDKK